MWQHQLLSLVVFLVDVEFSSCFRCGGVVVETHSWHWELVNTMLSLCRLQASVHTDVCGPMQTATLSGEHYCVTFIDEASGRIAIALLWHKGEVFENFVAYRGRAEKETGKVIKTLRSDGGGEYINAQFLKYLR